ncbi:mannosyl-glycoprotein endo-beta-N-acetylglucosamidase [Neolewinella aurantiaca]|uniref:Mannosyl-glycoprotein endo-beta-N-acetylglucosamidase n=1 Tax=Neolewinella aurantiaca TaxID=2602767 RepID=A0A5C7FIL9_9BACT|nr:glucosaminidase domain-containing protein [Neolewinella aurantiaca]TXF91091.1 mannosyl-glycoprotein endo-beta-N-acetylglucosamidase [Neolewinella aurantiaca]
MSVSSTPQSTRVERFSAKALSYGAYYAVEIFLIALILYFCISRGLSFSVDIYDPMPGGETAVLSEASVGKGWLSGVEASASALLASFIAPAAEPASSTSEKTVAIASAHDGFNEVARTDDPAPHISNLTLVLSPDYGERKGLPATIIKAKKERVQNYLRRYAGAAQNEMAEFGIPASITLAQGLLESNAGDSKLAVNSNNHFGIKCRSKCLGCTCRNYGDDTRYDMFRVFNSVAESFREHSKLLNTKRYAKLKTYGTDYVKWAHGLKACGYATDKNYGHKLVKIIENLGLDAYDRVEA